MTLDDLLDIEINKNLKELFGICPIELIHLIIKGVDFKI